MNTKDSDTKQVFISYAHSDRKANNLTKNIVDKVRDFLYANKISYWFDEDSIRGGDDLDPIIKEHINASECLLFISSYASKESTWCNKELAYAEDLIKNGKRPFRIIEFVVDNSGIKVEHKVAIDYYNQPNFEEAWKKLGICLGKDEDDLEVLETLATGEIYFKTDMNCYISCEERRGTRVECLKNKTTIYNFAHYINREITFYIYSDKDANKTYFDYFTLIAKSKFDYLQLIELKLLDKFKQQQMLDSYSMRERTVDFHQNLSQASDVSVPKWITKISTLFKRG